MSLIDDHLIWCERRALRPSYLRSLRWTLERLDRDIGPIELVADTELEDWYRTLDAVPGTRVTYAAHVSSFFRWLVRERLRDDNPADRLMRPKVRRGLPRPIRDESLRVALDLAFPPVSTWLLLGVLQGLRACEIATLHREDVRDGVLIVRDGKGGKQRILPLHPLVADALRGLPQSGPLFVGRRGRPILANSVTQKANRWLHSVGVTETLHTCRHRYATTVYQASHDLRLTQELLGHSDPATTARYAAWEPDRAAAVIATLGLPA